MADLKDAKVAELKPKEYTWETNEISYTSDPIVDLKQGKPTILRFFTFKFPPQLVIKRKPSKQVLFNSSFKQISDMLYKDGLIERRDIPPRVSVGPKGYTIYITAEPRLGVTVANQTQSLNEILQKK